MFRKCTHEWTKIAELTLPSAFEQVNKEGRLEQTTFAPSFYRKTFILVLACKKCGALDKTVVANKTY